MQCKSCQSTIDPKWKHATESNICPFCGSSIMDEGLCKVFEALRDILDDSFNSEYADQVKDWLCSNYNLIPSDELKSHLTDEDIQEYVDKGKALAKQELKGSVLEKMSKASSKQEELDEEKYGVLVNRQSPERNSEFLKRAGVPLVDGESVADNAQKMKSLRSKAKSEYKDLVAQIQSGKAQAPQISQSLEELKNLYPDDNEIEIEDDFGVGLEDESIPAHILNMGAVMGGGNANVVDYNAKDKMALERLKAKSQRPSGGGVFRRGD